MRIARWLAVAALIVGCGEDKQAVEVPCDVAGETATRTGANPVDCGDVTSASPLAVLQAAQKCALDASAAKGAFKLTMMVQGSDNELYFTYVGNGASASILQRQEHWSDAQGTKKSTSLSSLRCDALQTAASCTVGANGLCLACKELYESAIECVEWNDGSDCNPVGDYEVGKEGGYKPCCPGLREVFRTRQATGSNKQPVCADLPLRVSSCVAARCGDGVCDASENRACSKCTLDCP